MVSPASRSAWLPGRACAVDVPVLCLAHCCRGPHCRKTIGDVRPSGDDLPRARPRKDDDAHLAPSHHAVIPSLPRPPGMCRTQGARAPIGIPGIYVHGRLPSTEFSPCRRFAPPPCWCPDRCALTEPCIWRGAVIPARRIHEGLSRGQRPIRRPGQTAGPRPLPPRRGSGPRRADGPEPYAHRGRRGQEKEEEKEKKEKEVRVSTATSAAAYNHDDGSPHDHHGAVPRHGADLSQQHLLRRAEL
jgi:hypothetical protein